MGVKGTNKGNKEAFWDYLNTSGKRKYKNTHALGDGYKAPASATGGTKITEGAYTIHHFPNPSRTLNAEATFVLSDKDGPLTVDYIVIGGGGSGGAGDPGAYSGGGGGYYPGSGPTTTRYGGIGGGGDGGNDPGNPSPLVSPGAANTGGGGGGGCYSASGAGGSGIVIVRCAWS